MKVKKLALIGTICGLFATSLAFANKPIAVYAESVEEPLISEVSEEVVSSAEKEQKIDPSIPEIIESKLHALVTKILAIGGSVFTFLTLCITLLKWLVDRGLIKGNRLSADQIKEKAEEFKKLAEEELAKYEEKLSEQIGSLKEQEKLMAEVLAEAKKLLADDKKANDRVLEALAIIAKLDPSLVSAGAYRKIMPLLKGIEDEAGQ